MKEYKCFACPKYVSINATAILIAAVLEGIVFFPSDEPLMIKILFLIMAIGFISIPAYCFNKPAFSITRITKEGIRNRHLSFRWDEIHAYHICEIDQRLSRKIKHPLIVCVGDVKSKYLGFCDTRKAVCFSLTQKNLKIIEELCEEKNETISELLTWVHFPMY